MHWIQARKAFEQGAVGVEFHHLVGVDGVRLDLARIGDGAAGTLWVRDGERLAAILGRDDVSRHGGHPVVMANPAKHILGIAVGPEAMPAQIRLLPGVFDLEHHVLPGAEPGQPDWWLLDSASPAPTPPIGAGGNALTATG